MSEQPVPHVRAVPPLSVQQEGAYVLVSLKSDRTNLIQAVAAVLASAIAFASIWLVVAQWKEQRRAKGLEVMERFDAQFSSSEMIGIRAEAAKNHADPGATPAVQTVFNFFERVARHKSDGIITIDQADYFFRDYLLGYWYGYEDWVRSMRKAVGEDPDDGETFREFELLIAELHELGHKRPTDAEIRHLLELEKRRVEPPLAVAALQ